MADMVRVRLLALFSDWTRREVFSVNVDSSAILDDVLNEAKKELPPEAGEATAKRHIYPFPPTWAAEDGSSRDPRTLRPGEQLELSDSVDIGAECVSSLKPLRVKEREEVWLILYTGLPSAISSAFPSPPCSVAFAKGETLQCVIGLQ